MSDISSNKNVPLDWIALLSRMAMGFRFIVAGAGKLAYLPKLEAHYLGYPIFGVRSGAILISIIELGAGTALFIGWRARWAASVLVGILGLYTILSMVEAHGLLRRDIVFETVIFVLLLLWIVILGPGRFSLSQKVLR